MSNPLHAQENGEINVDSLVAATGGNDETRKSDYSGHHSFSVAKNDEDIFRVSSSIAPAKVPNMWTKDFIGLYSQYAAVGLLYGTSGVLFPFCNYVYKGDPNLCANSSSITFFAWNFKIFFAILTDIYRPFGLRRKPWMLFGWTMVLVILMVLMFGAHTMNASTWLSMLLLMQGFLMFSDVPADGYSVELGKLESDEQRGQILATGQRIRFTFSVLAGVIQTFLVNGVSTNAEGCKISFDECWSWGLTVNGYYGLLFALVFILSVPIVFLKEIDPTHIPMHNWKHFSGEIWDTLQNLTTSYLLIFVVGIGCFTNFLSNVNIYMQYNIIQLTNFEAGIDTVTSYGALVVAIYIFQKYLINRNWRLTQYGSTIVASLFGLLWIPAYYNSGGTRNAWYTIFIDLDQSFVNGLAQVLYSLSVIELAKPGQEATTYELIITVGNSASTLSGVFATQMLTPLRCAACENDPSTMYECPYNSVDTYNAYTYEHTDGPSRYTSYQLTLLFISITCCLIFTPFLPMNKAQCHEWRRQGIAEGTNELRGYLCLLAAAAIMIYGFVVAVLLLDSSTSCLPAVGGTGC